jgi:hypothetical protein
MRAPQLEILAREIELTRLVRAASDNGISLGMRLSRARLVRSV